jgi:pilus assembly protein FimV
MLRSKLICVTPGKRVAAAKKTVPDTGFNTAPKRLAAAIALALLTGAGSAWSAGLGRLSVQSGLGQPLRAEVEITALSREEAASLNARLASPEAFRQAGLEFNAALSGLRFTVDRRPDGRSFVRISSAQPINEPFVDMLLELNWATGKFVREYTFLLDPPELRSTRESVEGGAGQATVVPPVAAAAPAAPATATSAPVSSPSAQATPLPRREPAAAPAAPAAAAAAAPKAPSPVVSGDDIRVRAGDTLSGIAGRVRPPSASLDQTLASLYENNPQAFAGNINRLKAGVTLKMPSADQIAAMDAAKARDLIRAQSSDFAAYRSRLAEGAREVPGGKAGQSASGAVGAQVDDKSAGAANQDQLKLSKSGVSAAAGGAKAGGGTAVGQNAAEQSVARDAALKESASRVKELEKNVSDLQKLLELKNKQLADLQKQADDAKAASKVVAGPVAKADAPKTVAAPEAPKPEPVKAEAPKAVEPVAQAPKVDAPKPEAPKADAPAADAPKAETPKSEPAPAAAATVATPKVEPAPVPAPKAEATKAAAPETSFVDDLMSNPLMLPGLGAILALGAGYGWYAMRRRKKVEKFEDSLIAADGIAANSLFGSTGGQSVDTSSAFASATKDSGVDVHATEVDPIAEAEVYIAYGREAQAEEILREALRKQPERQAIRAKLLEIYSGRKDVVSYGVLAAEMHAMTGGLNEEWPKVVTMGLAIDPTNSLYSGRDAGSAMADPTPSDEPALAQLAEPPLDALPEDEPKLPAAPVMPTAHAVPSFAETLPMDPAELSAKSHEEPEIPALDFDLELDTTIGKAGEKLVSSRDPDEDETRSDLARAVEGRFELPDLDLGDDLPAKPADKVRSNDFSDGLEEFNIDLPALEGISKIAPSDNGGGHAVAEKIGADLDLSAIGLDLEPASAPASTSAPDGVRWQEMATKLDLASAYEEIGDKEGARELLDEVVKGGDGDQQQKARAMLAKIA